MAPNDEHKGDTRAKDEDACDKYGRKLLACAVQSFRAKPWDFFTAVGTIALAILAYMAWHEAILGTKALEGQLQTMERDRREQALLLDLSTRAILIAPYENWKIAPNSFAAGKAPILSFVIKNVGNTHAQILQATYEYALDPGLPRTFDAAKEIENFPALLSPTVEAPIIISGLPEITSAELEAINSGTQFLWLRTTFFYRDDIGTQFEIRFTGRYGRGMDANGDRALGFTFPDAIVPPDKWGDFRGMRCLNVLGSEPIDLNCHE